MDRIWKQVTRPRWYPVWVALLALIVLVPLVGSYGFWDPHEIKIADQAREVVDGKALSEVAENTPPLTVWAVSTSVDWLGPSELGARIPLTLLGIAAIIATFLLGRRLAGDRAGLIAGLILLATPMVLFESRQLISVIGATAGGAFIMLGLIGALWPRTRRTGPWIALYMADAALIALGAALGYYAVGALLGIFVPVAAMAAAGILSLIYRRPAEEKQVPRQTLTQLYAGSGVMVVVSVAVLLWVTFSIFDWVEGSAGDRALFGKTLRAGRDYVEALGGVWREKVPITATWDGMFEQIAFGFFPWVALAPFALGRAALGRGSRRRNWAGHAVFFWAVFAWIVGTIVTLKSGPVRYVAFPALAVAIGMWLDDFLASREGKLEAREALPPSLPMAALFVVIFAVMLGKDLKAFPQEMLSVHLVGADIEFPKNAARWLTALPLLFGVLIGGALWLGIWRPQPVDEPEYQEPTGGNAFTRGFAAVLHAIQWVGARASRAFAWVGERGIHGGIALGVVFAMCLSFVYTPKLSHSFSYKYLFDRYRDLGGEDAQLGVLGMPGSGPEYYAHGNVTKLANRNQMFEFLGRDDHVFVMGPRTDTCAIHQGASTHGFDYYVLDSSHAKFMLLSNQLPEGAQDNNPLKDFIRRSEPTEIKFPVDANFNDEIQLLGASYPSKVERGSEFEITLFFKVLKKPRRNWQMFLHFDGAGMRFQGDHWPLDRACGTAYWQPGDYIVDRHTMSAGDMTTPRRRYQIWFGFFVGSHGNWTNMKANSGNPDDNNRVPIGHITVE